MIKKTCPACRAKIDSNAVKCRHCHTAFSAEEMAAGRDEVRREGWQTVGAGVLILVGLIYWLTQPGNIEWLAQF